MAQSFKETAHLKTDKQKYDENFDSIDWSSVKDKPLPKPVKSKHITAGMCGEYGMSERDDEAYKENFDNIKWEKKDEL